MKKLLLLLLSCCMILICNLNSLKAQINLVPNPSFEQYDSCPYSTTPPWHGPLEWIININSVDYYNMCANILSGVSIPKNEFGFQIPYDGNAYIGLYNYAKTSYGDVREYIGTRLSTQLIPNQKYFVRFEASWANGWCATNKLGVLFSNIYYGDSTTWALIIPPPLINNFAHIYTNTIITDSVNWTTISGSFVADSAYKYIYIGNFFNRENIDTLWIYGGLPDCKSYYYIDNVCVSSDSITCNPPDGLSEIIEKQKIEIFPNPTKDYFNIKINENFKTCTLMIYDDIGNKVRAINLKSLINTIMTSNLKRGIYFLQIIINNKTISKKIIIN